MHNLQLEHPALTQIILRYYYSNLDYNNLTEKGV